MTDEFVKCKRDLTFQEMPDMNCKKDEICKIIMLENWGSIVYGKMQLEGKYNPDGTFGVYWPNDDSWERID